MVFVNFFCFKFVNARQHSFTAAVNHYINHFKSQQTIVFANRKSKFSIFKITI